MLSFLTKISPVSEELLMTPEGADQLCTAAYAALMGPNPQDWSVCWFPVTHWSTGSVRADDAYKGGGGTGDGWETHRLETFTLDATDGVTDSKWYHLCVSIQRCNSALRLLNICTEEQIPLRNRRIAEMKVLRAHYFFEMQRMFNLIPWYDETMDNATVQTTPNNEYPREELLDKIAEQIRGSIDNLPESQPEVGRVNQFMAKAYLAKVLLYRAYEQDPQTHAIVNINKEVLREVVSLCTQIRTAQKYDLFENFQDLINAFQTDADGLPVADYQSLPDFGQVTIEGDKAIITNYDHSVDPRLDFIIGRPNVTWKTYPDSPCLAQWVRDRGTYGNYCSKRFVVSPESPAMFPGWSWGASALNWHMIRYAHILLWEAEAHIELGEISEGVKLINQVRDRAATSDYVKAWTEPSKCFDGTCPDFNGYAANYKIGKYPETLTQEQARQAVRTESRLECAMEGERFFDLVRWGIAAEVMNKFIECEKDNRVYYQGVTFTAGKDEYLPITNNQYKFSGRNYVQNPGYAQF